MRVDFCATGSFIGSSSLLLRGGFMCVVAGVALGFSTLYTCLWLDDVCTVGGSKARFCGITSGRFEDISLFKFRDEDLVRSMERRRDDDDCRCEGSLIAYQLAGRPVLLPKQRPRSPSFLLYQTLRAGYCKALLAYAIVKHSPLPRRRRKRISNPKLGT